ncbi:sarcoplasmic calcium-binding protein-like [Mercenaria mercenaria]|uniref:sarcoplasmic calcium-binding protein-like n=1 Tax=Mercenaria mercenaria TaxID=6596 RepID=UPI00234F4796|nr:sarcoplasmic calcium-binding protein-like [Mercenaria mercenaria]
MASEYLTNKWKMWFKWLDINKDGKLDSKDMNAARERFVELNDFDAVKTKAAMDIFENWWKDFIFRGKVELSEEEFIESMNEGFKTDKDEFIERMRRCFQVAFNVVDINSEQNIDEEEFIVGFRTSGHENIELNKKFFEMYNPKKGLVSVHDLVESWVQFTTSEDMSKHDIVKAAFELGV